MNGDLFSKPAEYTIDSSSLMAMFDDSPWTSKENNPALWQKVEKLLMEGIIISHIEVLWEIRKDEERGEELFEWAQKNKHIFKKHADRTEGVVIRSMSVRFKDFVNAKDKSVHADPWLIAQAKCQNLKVISEEKFSNSPDLKKWKIPNVCADSLFGVTCFDLWALTRAQGWKFQ